MRPQQLPLFPSETNRPYNYPFPSTRYQGSKRTLTDWIWATVCELEFDTVLDVFGGTGAVSHMFKNAGKQVTYNDYLAFNWNIGIALIENNNVKLSENDIERVLNIDTGTSYPDFIQKTFSDIYFTDEENAWLDRLVANINHIPASSYKRALARFALFQACIIKRPYNLFHRANLYMRTAKVERSFGNKTTWDTPFETHFRTFIDEANEAVFDNGQTNEATCVDALETPKGFDLVYLDPPYINKRGTGVDYRDFYHFLEGLVNYDTWANAVDYNSKHRRLQPEKSAWSDKNTILDAFDAVLSRHRDSMIVISYRDDGVPAKEQLLDLLRQHKTNVAEAAKPKQYVLSNRQSRELLLVA